MAGEESRKILLELVPHSNKSRIPRKKARAAEVEGFSYRKTAVQESHTQKLH